LCIFCIGINSILPKSNIDGTTILNQNEQKILEDISSSTDKYSVTNNPTIDTPVITELPTNTPTITPTKTPTPTPTPSPTPLTYDIAVTSVIVKDVGGECRYFFDIRNNDEKDFEGKVTISLLQPSGFVFIKSDFNITTPLSTGLGKSVNMTMHTCPVAIHGDFGISDYKFVAKVNDVIVKEGGGEITTAFE
jgi:hypothetical protein